MKIELHCDSGRTDGDSIIDHEAMHASTTSSLDDHQEEASQEGKISSLKTDGSPEEEIIPPTSEMAAEEEVKEQPRRRSSLLSRLGSGLKLSNEKVDIADAGLRSQLSRLNKLMRLDTTKPKQRKRFLDQMTELLVKNPKLTLCRFKIDGYEEPLLHQVICKQPSLELVSLVYAFNPKAAMEKGFGNYTILHHACLCHNQKDVIQFLIQQEPQNLQARPFPPLFCAIDDKTDFQVLELLVKSYPDALCSCDVASVTPMDIALMEQLPLPIIQLFFSHYPRAEMKISQSAGLVEMHPEISSIFASEHHCIHILDATNMRFTQHGWMAFFRLMASNTTLTELLLNLELAEVDPDVCEALNKMVRENTSLRTLRISGRILPTAFANAIVNGFSENQSIQELTFLVHLDFVNIEGLIRNCADHPSLTRLTLRRCVAESTDWTGLSSLQSIERLDLSECKIGHALAEPIASLIETSKALKELNIARNSIGNEGTLLIANALRKNSSLQSFDYGHNAIGESGWQAFVTTLREHNTSLRSLGAALDDPFYDLYNEEVLYYCDQNDLGRTLSPRSQEQNPSSESGEEFSVGEVEDPTGLNDEDSKVELHAPQINDKFLHPSDSDCELTSPNLKDVPAEKN